MTDTFRALCAELVDIITAHANPDDAAVGYVAGILTRARALLAQAVAEGPTDQELEHMLYYQFTTSTGHGERVDEIGFARAVLARWGRPAAAPVPDLGEVAELVSWLRDRAESTSLAHAALRITRAADLLQRQYPQPVLVSERLPGPGEWVWHCYAGVRFWQHGRYNGRQFFIGNGPESQPATHWLPANALPAPEATND